MKIETLKERIEKAEAKISKKQNTILKKEALIQKKSDKFLKTYGAEWMTFDKYDNTNPLQKDYYWDICDIESLQQDIIRLEKEIPEIQKTLEKYQMQLSGELAKESMFITEIPEIMKNLELQLIKEWDVWDLERQNRLTLKYQEIGYKEFVKKYTYSSYEFIHKAENDIHEENCRSARQEVLDLFIRVKDITGEVTDWSGIRCEQGNTFPVLTGTVIGKEGKAQVETIIAGGYNIQKLHIRTLVHSI